ncbi:MAG: response regulator [Bacilli bacterium]|nr:response regulator [Bacilli bacterium]MDD4282723.1 response regulator [Bacilli bacterium]
MKENIKKIIILLTALGFIIGSYFLYDYFDLQNSNVVIFSNKLAFMSITLLLLIIIFYFNTYFRNRKRITESRHRDKLFNSLVQNSDTAYFMYDETNKKIIYMTKNIKEVLNINNIEDEEAGLNLVTDILANPIIKEELRNWDKKSEFISQMVSYNYIEDETTKRIRVKIYPFTEKKHSYQIISVLDVSKEYAQQHLLIIQAKDIKAREKQLNQITSTSYDFEININMTNKEFNLKNLKGNINYFGSETTGSYDTGIAKIISEYVHEEDQAEVSKELSIDNFRKLIEEENLEPRLLRYRLAKTEDIIWLESSIFFLSNKGENRIIILTKNVTENAEYMRNQNNLLQGALKDVERANNAKSEFMAVLSHQIRTQMTSIIGLSQSALSDNLPLAAREDVENINNASNNLLEIIDEMLDISKIESGVLEKNEKEYDVASLFRNLIGLTKEQIGTKKIKLVTTIDKNIPSKLFGDSSKIRQIILPIINNAIKYTDSGSVTITANTTKKQQNVELVITIEDTGIGIERKQLDKLFDVKENTEHSQNMGLSIIKRLINLLNGKIVVESELGKGSKFTVSIIQKVIDEKPIGNIEEYVTEKGRKDYFNAEGKSVLIVDDNKLNLKVAVRFLEPYGLDIESVESGQECLDLINNGKKFDLILLDQMMPDMNGTETLNELKKDSKFSTPVIVLTADAIVGVKEKYLDDGFDDYLSKPIDAKELKKLLKKYLSE